ncbi:MAG: heterodisulfide reductase-related iron-sulfur binding cluster [Methanomassiliicoccaceae archaeon]|nr:heterodisulfide reductase-related iron-sulfur binding cluster [Methanomassiliicoccaceae archaeon]
MKLFPGCTVSSRLPFVESAVRYIAERLEIEISPSGCSMCCFEPTGLRSMDPDMWMSVGSMVHSMNRGESLVTLCEGCNLSLSSSEEALKTEEGAADAKERLSKVGMDFGTADVRGLLEFLYENIDGIRRLAKVPADGMGAVFPGCHGEFAYKIRGSDAGTMMSEILDAAGCNNIVIRKPMCCGGGLQGVNDQIANGILQDTVGEFKEAGAGFAVVSCVFCFRRLDISAKYPVMHISEVVARSMGWGADTSRYHRTKL